MNRFFSANEAAIGKFQVFSPLHVGILSIICALLLCLFVFRKTLRPKSARWRYLIAGLLLLLECSYQIWLVWAGKWDLKTTLPIELCEISSILAAIMLFTNSYFLFQTVYFWGCLGSILALIFPDLPVTYAHFRFWIFMLSHTLNLVALAWMIALNEYRPTIRSIGIGFLMINVYMLFIGATNHFLGSNYYFYYVFRHPAPDTPGLFAAINSGLIKLLVLEGMTLLAFLACYIPFPVISGLRKIKYPLM
jgi:hypothetical integral membrane protein (TIGR02206 family)